MSDASSPISSLSAGLCAGRDEDYTLDQEGELERTLYAHAPCTSRHPPTLLQTLDFALAGILGLALHEIIVVVFASRTDEE